MANQSEHVAYAIGILANTMCGYPNRKDRVSIRAAIRTMLDSIEAEDAEPVTQAAEVEPAPALVPKNCHSCANIEQYPSGSFWCSLSDGGPACEWRREHKLSGTMPEVNAPDCPDFKARK